MSRIFTSMRSRRSLLAVATLSATMGCGYTAEEWQMQLDKAQNLERQIEEEKLKIQKLEAELAARQGKRSR